MTQILQRSFRRRSGLAGLVLLVTLVLATAEAPAQVIVSGGGPWGGYNTGVMGTTGIAGGYSSYGSRSFSSFGLGGFQRSFGTTYSSAYVSPGVVAYPVYGGYPVYGSYPAYGGYPVLGAYPIVTPPISTFPGGLGGVPGMGGIGAGRLGGYERVQGGTYIPGFGVMGGVR